MINDKSLLEICNAVASNSKCLSRKIGVVIVKDGVIVATGWNGPPRKVPHCWERHWYDEKLCGLLIKKGKISNMSMFAYASTQVLLPKCPRQLLGFKSGEGLEWCVAVHAERNALINCAREGISTKGCKMFMNCLISCTPCLVEIINAGISEIIVTDFKYYDKSAEYLIMNSNLIVRNFNGEYLKK